MSLRDTYIFDKRVVKKAVTKFLISCLAAFPFLLALNILTSDMFDFWVTVVLDSILLLVFVFIGGHIYDSIAEKRAAKRERRRAEHMALAERKQQIIEDSKKKQAIMQDSYKRIREEKKAKKKKMEEVDKEDKSKVAKETTEDTTAEE